MCACSSHAESTKYYSIIAINLKNSITETLKILDKINNPQDLKNLNVKQLKDLAIELREETIKNVSKTGGHLGAGLGVIELTIALHYVFNAPDDKIIWDVGHQAYPHKILTERRDMISTIRQPNGLSGFTRRAESKYDPFGAGHSSTSISAGFGIEIANQIKKQSNYTIAVIGDGAISAGMAFEAMNNAGDKKNKNKSRFIVILNDNDMSISPPTGAMSNYLSKLTSSKAYFKFRNFSKKVTDKISKKFPKAVVDFPRKFEKSIKEWWMGGNIFEELGFYYIGAIDGHNLDLLINILNNIKSNDLNKPILIHCITEKGKGFNQVMPSDDKLHAVTKFDLKTGLQQKKPTEYLSYSKIFGNHLNNLAKLDKSIVAITAAMPNGTGLDIFAKNHPDNFFDVGIAEQHAVTFGAGLATEGIKSFVAIYSTFLQRAYDQIIHDVALQSLPVRFIIDRAGFVGADGPTHCGAFDIAYLINLPNFILMAPSNGQELIKMINTANTLNNNPSAIRFPRGEAKENINFNDNEILEIGKAKIVQNCLDDSAIKVVIIAFGSIIENAISASKILETENNLKLTIVDARFAKPIDENIIFDIAQSHQILITIEEGAIGGFGSIVAKLLADNKNLDSGKLKFRSLFMADKFIEQNEVSQMQEESGIGINSIVATIRDLLY